MNIYKGLDVLQALTDENSGNPAILQRLGKETTYPTVYRYNFEKQRFEWTGINSDWSINDSSWKKCANSINWYLENEFVEYPGVGLKVGDWAVDETNRVAQITKIEINSVEYKNSPIRVYADWDDDGSQGHWGLNSVRKANDEEIRNTKFRLEVSSIFRNYGRRPFSWRKGDMFTYGNTEYMVTSSHPDSKTIRAKELFGSEGMIPRKIDIDAFGIYPMYFVEHKMTREEDEGCR
ncbi:hypothetical protein [Bacillus phage YungSlug]|nr:hypothetical protein [Bacillus phage YungSlug]